MLVMNIYGNFITGHNFIINRHKCQDQMAIRTKQRIPIPLNIGTTTLGNYNLIFSFWWLGNSEARITYHYMICVLSYLISHVHYVKSLVVDIVQLTFEVIQRLLVAFLLCPQLSQ